ncbi:MAG: hypothetical protein ACI4PW_08845 [Alphaproteobacteria bacterium]
MLTFLKKMKDKVQSISLFKQELVFFAAVFVADIILYVLSMKFYVKYSEGVSPIHSSVLCGFSWHLLFSFLFVITNFVYLFTHLTFNDKLIYSDFCKAVFALTIFCIFYLCLSFPFDWVMFMDPPKEDFIPGAFYLQGGGFTEVFFIFLAFQEASLIWVASFRSIVSFC